MSEEKKNSLIDMLQQVGLDNVAVQPLHGSISDISITKKGTKITFLTDPVDDVRPIASGERIGLICWFDREHLKKG